MWGYVVRAVDVVWIVKARVQRGIRCTFHVVQHVPVKDHTLHALKKNRLKSVQRIRILIQAFLANPKTNIGL
jgi:hypothetical protein